MLILGFLSAYDGAYRFHDDYASSDLSATVLEADFSISAFMRSLLVLRPGLEPLPRNNLQFKTVTVRLIFTTRTCHDM